MEEIPLYFYFPMERIFDGTDQENSKTQGREAQIRKIQKNNMERMEERKRRDFYIRGGSPTHVFCISRQHQGLRPSCNPPSGEPTHMRTSPTTLKLSLVFQYCHLFDIVDKCAI